MRRRCQPQVRVQEEEVSAPGQSPGGGGVSPRSESRRRRCQPQVRVQEEEVSAPGQSPGGGALEQHSMIHTS
ncbi:hypothetical protein OYC64_010240 [Pagothenia borchgrevinki]|uniref:Uncharacterized protein n=1 Tax=Pagothenia borchgrevinki TaxID=8213 RepID=A0ABD2GVV4_PAGBO